MKDGTPQRGSRWPDRIAVRQLLAPGRADRSGILRAVAGLVSVISQDRSAAVPREELDALIRAYGHVRGQGRAETESVGAWMHCARLEGNVGEPTERDGASWCATVGNLFSSSPRTQAPLTDVDGQFAAIRYRAAEDELDVFNDPFGMQAMYVAERDGRTYVSTSATALARHLGAAPDPLGAAMFLRAGRQFGPVTHWRGIRRLDPASVLTFGRFGPTASTYWRPTVDERVRAMSLIETADHCAQALLSTLERRFSTESCIKADITGGFDSRMIVAALGRLGLQFSSQTAGDPTDADVRLAREVARAGGFEWQHETLPDDWSPSPDDVREAVAWGEGSLDALQLSDVLWRQRFRARSCPLVITGGGGEHFGPSPWAQEFLRAGRSREINYDNLMAMRSLTPFHIGVLRTDPTPTVEAYMRDVLSRYVGFLSGELNTTQLDAVFLYRAMGHFGSYRSASEAHTRTEIPCYYKDIFTTAFSAHHRFRNGYRLHRTIIGRTNRIIGEVETERGGPAQRMRPANVHRFAPYYVRLGKTAVRKIRRRPAPHGQEGPAEAGYRRAITAMRTEGTLDPAGMRSGELYDTAGLRDMLDRATKPGFDAWAQLGRIVTLELALRSVDGASLTTLIR